MKIGQTCCCGSAMVANDNYPSACRAVMLEWLEAHAPCRAKLITKKKKAAGGKSKIPHFGTEGKK